LAQVSVCGQLSAIFCSWIAFGFAQIMKVRFDLYVRYTIEVDIPQEGLSALQHVQKRANQDFAYVLREYIPNIEIFGLPCVPGGFGASGAPAMPIRSDDEIRQYLHSLPNDNAHFEVRIPNNMEAGVQAAYQQSLNTQMNQINALQGQVTELRTQGYGCQQGFTLLQQCAPKRDEDIAGIVLQQGQGVDPCVTAMVGSPTDQWIHQQGLRVLTYYGMENPTNLEEIFNTGGFQSVVQAMENFPEDAMIQQYAHHIIANASKNPQYSAELHRLGVINPLIRNLNHFGQDPRVQQYGCWALGELAATPDYRDEIVKAGGIDALLNALKNFPRDPYVNRYALSALHPLACNPLYAPMIINQDGVRQILQAMRNHNGDAQVAFHGMTMLAELAKHDDCKAKLCEEGVIPVILGTMKAYSNDWLVQEAGLRCLAVLAAGSPANQEAIYKNGGIPPVIHAVNGAVESRKNDDATTALIAQGLNLLANLATHPECRPQIVHCKGVEAVLGAMKALY